MYIQKKFKIYDVNATNKYSMPKKCCYLTVARVGCVTYDTIVARLIDKTLLDLDTIK